MIKVSIIIPAYNCDRFVAKCINSVLEQDISCYEVLVCDDASSDNTYQELLNFTDPRIRLFKNSTNLGKLVTVQKLLDVANGEYCTILDSDDYIANDKLKKQSDFLDKNSDYAFIASSFYRVSEAGLITSEEIIESDFQGLKDSFLNANPMAVCCGTVMFRTEYGKELGGYNQYFTDCNGEDLDFICRLLSYGRGCSSSDLLYFYRYRANSLTRRVFATPRQRHSHEIISFLYQQRLSNGGKDSLNSNLEGLSEFIETLSNRYNEDTGLMKRMCSVDFALNKQHSKALGTCILGFRLRYLFSSLKTFAFVISIIMVPKFILLYLKGLFNYKNISKKL